MKKKLLIYILVLIFLFFVGCTNEMEMLEDNSTLKAGNERLFMPDSLRDLIEYDRNSMDQYSIRKLENILELLYTFPETNKMLNSLKDGLKVKMEITGGSSSLGEAWYDPIYPPKIGFLREVVSPWRMFYMNYCIIMPCIIMFLIEMALYQLAKNMK